MLVKLKSTRSRPYPVTVARLKGITYLEPSLELLWGTRYAWDFLKVKIGSIKDWQTIQSIASASGLWSCPRSRAWGHIVCEIVGGSRVSPICYCVQECYLGTPSNSPPRSWSTVLMHYINATRNMVVLMLRMLARHPALSVRFRLRNSLLQKLQNVSHSNSYTSWYNFFEVQRVTRLRTWSHWNNP